MSTEPNQQVVNTANAVGAAIQKDAQIVYHTVQGVHPVWIIVLVAVLGAGGFYVSHYLEGFQKALADANAKAQQFDQLKQATDAQLIADKNAITSLAQQQVKVVQVQAATDQKAAQTVQQVKEDVTVPAVAADSKQYLGVTPTVTSDGQLAYQTPDVKQFVITKIEHDQFQSDLSDEKQLYGMEQQKTTKLTSDLASSQKEVAKSEQVAEAYKSVAVKSKGRKILDALKRVGEDALIAGAAYEVGKSATK